ncbi:DoxX family protein [Niveispirillum irakense]|uniref:DoxX family protein n=1 Tax=Niveispirillum irakense TaxID=34011 RepID=UPI000429EE5F|nr:DoxX family protein [Niveispirillum irakense]
MIGFSKYIDFVPVIGRVMLSAIFLTSGLGKIVAWDASLGYVASAGIALPSGLLLGAAVLTEVVGGAMVLLGFQARLAALALALFSVVTGVLFHNYWALADAQAAYIQQIMFWKNIAMAGGFLQVVAFGAGPFALDNSEPAEVDHRVAA